MSQTRQRAAFDYLLQQFAASAGQSAAQRWRYLEAAHVLGQNRLALHLRAHWLHSWKMHYTSTEYSPDRNHSSVNWNRACAICVCRSTR